MPIPSASELAASLEDRSPDKRVGKTDEGDQKTTVARLSREKVSRDGGYHGRWKIELPAAGTNALATSAFATYVLSLLGYLVYLLHGFLPTEILRSHLLITYYPSSRWSLILPAWITVAVWFAYVAYFSRNLLVSPPIQGPHGLRSITDQAALVLFPLPPPLTPRLHSVDQPVPVLRDLPCQVVNQFYFH